MGDTLFWDEALGDPRMIPVCGIEPGCETKKRSLKQLQCEAPKIAWKVGVHITPISRTGLWYANNELVTGAFKLWFITPITMVYGTYNYSYWGESKPTYNWVTFNPLLERRKASCWPLDPTAGRGVVVSSWWDVRCPKVRLPTCPVNWAMKNTLVMWLL